MEHFMSFVSKQSSNSFEDEDKVDKDEYDDEELFSFSKDEYGKISKQKPVPTSSCILPLKFRFKDEESKNVEKLESEKMKEGLFSEMYTFMYSNINNNSPKVC